MAELSSGEISGFLLGTEPLMEQLDNLPFETAVELYDMLDIAARAAAMSAEPAGRELLVKLCGRQDEILERVIDTAPPTAPLNPPVNIYTPAVHNYRRWSNAELMKDKGLVGYTLAKELGARAIMYFCANSSDYPYLSFLPGMEILYGDSANGLEYAYCEFLFKDYSKMDILILHGLYKETIGYLNAYRELRPDGKVFCGLDMNSTWSGKINWGSPIIGGFLKQCDIITTSCRFVRDSLNRNPAINAPCRWFPNGFYNPTGAEITADPERKENIILTVGRIGTKEKNNAELLAAFAQVSDVLPEWSVRLVGPIEQGFQVFINNYFTSHPDLRERVIFTGEITDKDELYREYSKAKIFALTSPTEGGPNVYAEALFHGCMFITSDIDAADDITNFGKLGMKYELGDINALASSLVTWCSKADKTEFERHIPKALSYAARYYDWNRNAKKLAFMLGF